MPPSLVRPPHRPHPSRPRSSWPRSSWPRAAGLPRHLLLALLLLLPSSSLIAAGTVLFVHDGQPLGIYEPGSPWTRGDGFLEGTGEDARLLADHDIGAKDFEIHVVLSLAAIQATGACLEIGKGRFGFDGDGETLFIEGFPNGKKLESLGPTRKYLREGRPFELKVQRDGTRLRVWIDGRQIIETKANKEPLGEFGIRPRKATVRVHRFWAKGDLLDVDRRVRIDPAEFASLAREERIDHAIDAGTEYLLSLARQQSEGYVTQYQEHRGGEVALETYALIVAGIPVDDPLIEENFASLDRDALKRGRTYDLACILFAHDAAISQIEYDRILTSPWSVPATLEGPARNHRKSMQKALDVLLGAQNGLGAWRYDSNSSDFDHSCTQFAALGLGVAARRGLRIPDDSWRRLAEHLLDHQQESGPETARRAKLAPGGRPEFAWSAAERERRETAAGRSSGKRGGKEGRGGTTVTPPEIEPDPFVGTEEIVVQARGWEYAKRATDGATWNMTCSGVSSLMLVYSHGGAALSSELRKKVALAIRDGIGRMMDSWDPHASLYGLYSLEKVADIGGIGTFDGHDWYEDSSRWLLDTQNKDGSWKSGGTGEIPRVSTALALLVLRRATTLLTRNPAEQIIFTGSGELSRTREQNRSWVYLPRLDKSVSYPGLLRTLRLRPSAALLGLLEELCENYPEEYSPELIPSLVTVRARLLGRGPAAVIDRCLVGASGQTLKAPEAFLAWFDRWSEIQHLAAVEGEESTLRLESLYLTAGEDVRLKTSILHALIRAGGSAALPALLPDLDHVDLSVRILVYRAVTAFHVDPPPRFDPVAEEQIRRAQAENVRRWVEKQDSQGGD